MVRKIVACAGILALTVSAVGAQDEEGRRGRRRGGGPERMLGGAVDRLAETLSLSEEQVEQVQAVYDEVLEELKAAQEKTRGLIEDGRDAIKDLLDEEQLEKYEEMLAAGRRGGGRGGREGRGGRGGREGRGGQGGRRGGGLPPVQVLAERLELTEDQIAELEPLYEEAREEIREKIRELREEGMDPREMRGEIEKIMQGYVGRVKEVLTDDQNAKLDEMIAESRRVPSGEGGREGRRRRPNVDEVVAKLGMDEEDAADLKMQLNDLFKLGREMGEFNRSAIEDLRTLLDEDASDEDIQAKMEELDAARREKSETMREAREAILATLTPSQIARLMVEGVLR